MWAMLYAREIQEAAKQVLALRSPQAPAISICFRNNSYDY